jgi:hypothetical protein
MRPATFGRANEPAFGDGHSSTVGAFERGPFAGMPSQMPGVKAARQPNAIGTGLPQEHRVGRTVLPCHPGRRDYLTGTRHALFTLSQGTCYYPDCDRQVISWIDASTPTVDAHIAHIHGAYPGSPRYDPNMTDDKRRSFPNLTLLCKPHHDLVDKIRPDDYPAELLKRWKADREGGETAALGALTEDQLEELIVEAVRQAGPTRQVAVDVGGGFLVDLSAGVLPIAGWQTILELNPHLAHYEKVLVTTVRNVGALRTSVESVDIHLGFHVGKTVIPVTMMGRNDYPMQNRPLPHALESGDQLIWLTALTTIEMMRASGTATNPTLVPAEVWSVVRLGSGEQIASERHTFDQLPLPPVDSP